MSKSYKTYTTEFKKDAVELSNELGLSKASKELGIPTSTIGSWKKALRTSDEGVSLKDGEPSYNELLKEVKRLRKEAEYNNKINDVLKKSLGIVSSDHLSRIK